MAEVRDLKVKLGMTEAVIDNFHMFGILYGIDDGSDAWWICAGAQSGDTSGSEYWIEGGDVYHVASSSLHNMTPLNLTWRLEVARDIKPELKKALLKAVAGWESKRKAQGEG